MRNPTPVTVIAITAASGSHRKSTPTRRGPKTAHWYRCTTVDRLPGGRAMTESHDDAAAMKPTATAADATTPAALPIRRAAPRRAAGAPHGAMGISQTYTRLPPHDRQVVHVRAVPPAEYQDDDREPDRHLGGGDDHHEQDDHLARDRAVEPRKGDEGDVDRVEHQLDAHEEDECVLSQEHAEGADREEKHRQTNVVRGRRHLSAQREGHGEA